MSIAAREGGASSLEPVRDQEYVAEVRPQHRAPFVMPIKKEGFMHRPSLRSATAHTTINEENLEEQIRTRAYELYEERGRDDGHDQEDWLRAETEITGKTMRKAA